MTDPHFDFAMNDLITEGIVRGTLGIARTSETPAEWSAFCKELITQALTHPAFSDTERVERALKLTQYLL